jgi:hypothetical protein
MVVACWGASAPASPMDDIGGSLALTAGAGQLGSQPVYELRLGYFPLAHLGMEATLAHNVASSLHAVLHYVNASAPVGTFHRVRPFATAGLGTIEVFPSGVIDAKPVTHLLLNAGGGLWLVLRDDISMRFEARSFTVFDQQEGHRGAYGYGQWSVGFTFHRSLHAPGTSETGAAP